MPISDSISYNLNWVYMHASCTNYLVTDLYFLISFRNNVYNFNLNLTHFLDFEVLRLENCRCLNFELPKFTYWCVIWSQWKGISELILTLGQSIFKYSSCLMVLDLALLIPFLKQTHMATDPSCSPLSKTKKWEINPCQSMENVSHKSVTTVENVVNQLELSHSVHHFDGCLRLLDLLQIFALIWRNVREPLHPFILLVHIFVFRDIVLVQAVDVDTDDKNFLKTFPHNILLLRVSIQRKVMRLE